MIGQKATEIVVKIASVNPDESLPNSEACSGDRNTFTEGNTSRNDKHTEHAGTTQNLTETCLASAIPTDASASPSFGPA